MLFQKGYCHCSYSGERMLRLGCDCYCALLLLLRLLLPPFLKLGGKQKALFKDSGLRTFPHAFDSLSSKPFIARQSKRSLPAAAAAPRRRLHSRSTVDRSTMLLLYYTSSNTQWRLFNKKDYKIIWFCVSTCSPIFWGLKKFVTQEKIRILSKMKLFFRN